MFNLAGTDLHIVASAAAEKLISSESPRPPGSSPGSQPSYLTDDPSRRALRAGLSHALATAVLGLGVLPADDTATATSSSVRRVRSPAEASNCRARAGPRWC